MKNVIIAAAVISISVVACAKYRPASVQHQSGWFLLGVTDTDVSYWLTSNEYYKNQRRSPFRLPIKGDKLTLIRQPNLTILGYKSSGGKNLLISPVGRDLTEEDDTDVKLPVGTKIIVEEVSVSGPLSPRGFRPVWIRVSLR